ncbi:uvi31 [Candida pseudojiufengensis]|uniref:uvi31 n=1 Tax=Candida pseudojiufengensis TaxID=497109 RepID=UPI002224DB87|nr:uvi31 [Candida pseudojiufengensis]KAI5962279.1 uvi31 [Candida pseudojiufengensis]
MFKNFIRSMSSSTNIGPIESSINSKLTTTFKPTFLEVRNDSHKHSHHSAMKGATNTAESHFFIKMQSEEFNDKNLPNRHRLVYGLLDDEFKNKGLHALQMKLKGTNEKLE